MERRRLGNHGDVARDPGPDRRQHPASAVLLGGHRDEQDLAAELDSGLPDRARNRPNGGQARDHPTFHVDRAAAVQLALDQGRRPGRGPPQRFIADGHDVDVAKDDRPATARPAGPADHHRQVGPVNLAPGPVRIAGQSEGIRVGLVHDQTRVAHQAGHHCLDSFFGSGDARDGQDRPELALDPSRIERVDGRLLEDAQGLGLAGAHPCVSRQIGRVRQVGPPEPLSPISVAAYR